MEITREYRIIAVSEFITIAGIVVFWGLFYLYPSAIQGSSAYRFQFDSTFPLLDGIFCVGLFLAGITLLKRQVPGRGLSLICALYLIYLGIVDLGIPDGTSIIALSIIDIVASGFVNLWCVVLGLYTILKLKKA